MNTQKIKKNIQLATLCYVKNVDHTLMICKDKSNKSVHFGKYNGLGGKVKPNESIKECLHREVYEESAVGIIDPELIGIILFPKFTCGIDWLVFVYISKASTTKFIESDEGSLSWVQDEKIFDLPMWEGDKEFLPLVLAGEKFFGRFNYSDSRLLNFNIVKV